ncbi:unnamed protein product, partial [Mycena citricolor]
PCKTTRRHGRRRLPQMRNRDILRSSREQPCRRCSPHVRYIVDRGAGAEIRLESPADRSELLQRTRTRSWDCGASESGVVRTGES